jgi:hypothetical protein
MLTPERRPQRQGSAGLRWACLVLTSCWALAAIALSAWVFRAWMEPLPAFSPNDGPIAPDASMSFWVGGAAMAAPLAALTVASAVTGSEYLSSVRSAGRAGAAWVSAVIAAVTAEVVFISVFVAPVALLGMAPGRVNWGLLTLPASFAAVGGAMDAIIIAAARSTRRLAAAG